MPGPDLSGQAHANRSPSRDGGKRASKHSNGSVRQSGTYNPRASQRVHGSRMGGSRMSMARGSRMTARGTDGALPNDHRVYDEEGRERTPKPMLSMRPALRPYPSMMGESVASTEMSESVAGSSRGLNRMSSAGFSRAGFSTGSMTPEIFDDDSLAPSPRSSETGGQGMGSLKKEGGSKAKDAAMEAEVAAPAMLTAADLEASMCVTLCETETMWLLDLPGTSVNMDSDEARAVEQANERYKELLKIKESSDRFVEAEAQTLNPLLKTKEAQSATTSSHAAEAQATTWEIHDTYHGSGGVATDAGEDSAALGRPVSTPPVGAQEEGLAAGGGGSMMSVQGDGRLSRMASVDAGSTRDSSTGSTRTSAFGSQMMLGSQMERGSYSERTSITASSVAPSLISGMPSHANGMPAGARVSTEETVQVNPLAKLTGLLDALKLMDAAVMQNAFHDKLLLYRNVHALQQQTSEEPDLPAGEASEAQMSEVASTTSDAIIPVSRMESGMDPDALEEAYSHRPTFADQADTSASSHNEEPRMELLWEWQCELTAGLNAACMGWNKVRTDIMAVGYGQHEFGPPRPGLVAFWSLKNPGYPLWTFTTTSGVTALDFSAHNPNMLAVGMYDGTVAVYDVKSRQGTPAMASSAGAGKHSDPVWKLKWIDRGLEHEEVLVSISTDGRVTQWSITKGLEHTDLMKLKRVVSRSRAPAPASAAARNIKSEAFISRRSSGMSFDFSGRDARMYIAGTEDGHIHKCSTSYAEQYLESYSGHMGPVYQVQWSPFQADLFLSASADWTVRLWADGKASALLTFQSGTSEVNDVQWCPSSSTVFGSVTNGGRMEIWDIAHSTVKPIAQHEEEGIRLLCMLFASSSPIAVAGCSSGAVRVYRLFNLAGFDEPAAAQAKRLDEAMRANIVKGDPAQTAAKG